MKQHIIKIFFASFALLLIVGYAASNTSSPTQSEQSAPIESSVPSVPATLTQDAPEPDVAASTVQAQEAAPPAVPVEPPIQISALDLYTAYQANEVAADIKYKGKWLAVRGTVDEISKDFKDNPYVTLKTSNDWHTVNAYFGQEKIDELSKLKKGDDVTITCRGDGMWINRPRLDCHE